MQIRSTSIEQMFLRDFQKVLLDYEQKHIEYIITGVQDDYPERVGYVKAIRDIKLELEHLLKAYFPNE